MEQVLDEWLNDFKLLAEATHRERQLDVLKDMAKCIYEQTKEAQIDKANKLEAFVWFHIYHLNKPRALKAFEKYKGFVNDQMDAVMFGNNVMVCSSKFDKTTKTNSEALRYYAMTVQKHTQFITLAISVI